jgi:Fe(3+) dicitrate transport protein
MNLLSLLLTLFIIPGTEGDSIKTQTLNEVKVYDSNRRSEVQKLPEVSGTWIYAGKKNSRIDIAEVQGNTANNTTRQILAKVPGINIWESDGSGLQLGIAARGLSPNRSWEFNIRQNGYEISADPFGYPEAYYTPPLQAVRSIEVVRGQGSLQYGSQFGGMVNFRMRDGSAMTKKIEGETQQTVGSYGLFSSFNALGGKSGKVNYYAFYDHRNAEGWRQNSEYNSNTGFGTVTWQANERLNITAEVLRYYMVSQQPGGLTDVQFESNARQSARSRNWMNIGWTTASIRARYTFSESRRLEIIASGIAGDRNSIGFMPSGGITVADTVNESLQSYNPRSIDRDLYRNAALETRYLGDYKAMGKIWTINGGVRFYTGNTDRFKGGKGSTGSDFDLTRSGDWSTDLELNTMNIAAFAENIFRVGNKLMIIPGVRLETVTTGANGYNGIVNSIPQPVQDLSRSRTFMIAGIGFEYHLTEHTEFYASWSQAYRPMLFSDLTASPSNDVIDADLEDAKGWNADFGYRGTVGGYLFFDLGAFALQYDNRVGTIKQTRADGTFYNFRTNVADSRTYGTESLVEFHPMRVNGRERKFDASVFASYAYNDAKYEDFRVVIQSGTALDEKNYEGNTVEYAPEHIIRGGVTFRYMHLAITAQHSYTSESFSDAQNTELASANGQNGIIPEYGVSDLTVSWTNSERLMLRGGINNVTDERYFTRRAGGYPGPGILPAEGRSFFAGASYRF